MLFDKYNNSKEKPFMDRVWPLRSKKRSLLALRHSKSTFSALTGAHTMYKPPPSPPPPTNNRRIKQIEKSVNLLYSIVEWHMKYIVHQSVKWWMPAPWKTLATGGLIFAGAPLELPMNQVHKSPIWIINIATKPF